MKRKSDLSIVDFTIEYRRNPLGLDEARPRFSWKLISGKKNVLQKAYRLSVYCGETLMWDGGDIKSGSSVLVSYGGSALSAQTEYRAAVKIKDNHGDTASAELFFETGLLAGGALKGLFIAPDRARQPNVSQLFTSFNARKEIKRARLYATALGMYKAEINGKKAGNIFFAPGWTSYNNLLQYQTYDATDLIVRGDNELSLTIAKGWYRGIIAYGPDNYGTASAALCELHIFYADGTRDIVVTDKAWRAQDSYISDSEIYDGETQDYIRGLSETYPVKEIEYDKNKINAQICEPVCVTERLKPVKHIITPAGERVLDFGQNLTGLVEFSASGERGQTVRLRHAEVLDPQGNFYTDNLNSAKAEDTFILSGGQQTLCAEFTFHGFRYVELNGIDDIRLDDFTALVIHSDLKKTGAIVTSDETVNRFLLNVEWSQRDNFVDIPTDCPQRAERLGWTGDANVFFRTAAYQYDVALFFKKWLKDLAFGQKPDGSFPWSIPDVNDGPGFDALWSDAATMIPYNFYMVYGDVQILNKQYPSMKKFIEGLSGMCSPEGLVVRGHQFGDWLALDRDEFMARPIGLTDVYFIANAFYIVSLRIMIETARILNNTADAEYYGKKLNAVHKAFLKEYVTAGGRLVSETQTACVLALHFNLVPKKYRQKIAGALKGTV